MYMNVHYVGGLTHAYYAYVNCTYMHTSYTYYTVYECTQGCIN